MRPRRAILVEFMLLLISPRWCCEQETELAPATSYVSVDECLLHQCLVDLQTETQTRVSLGCGGGVEAAHVKTGSGKWYSFNDEQVTKFKNWSTSTNPQETHHNYFSLANVAQKYKHQPGLRVSREVFVCVYMRSGQGWWQHSQFLWLYTPTQDRTKSVKRGVCVCIHEIRPVMVATQSVPLVLHSLHKPVLFLHLRLW
ncbi:hypothetical protein Pcinc_035072 [Petrolisthes cinctipes]|uniref:Uncharacterized protein n=1 Tax=Petrolisthes cinctipes TaxID=88211 RepID=A0AAE1C1D7_PETCI|nr:hypothetical protein Pcinc_035072 [Petrolisthes cinctipes]